MTNDEIQTLCVALGPGLIGLFIVAIGSRLPVSRWPHMRIWFGALTFVLLQTAMALTVCFIFGGGISINSFTIVAGSGLLVEAAALVLYAIKAFKISPIKARRPHGSQP